MVQRVHIITNSTLFFVALTDRLFQIDKDQTKQSKDESSFQTETWI